jgi:hypothetical protein
MSSYYDDDPYSPQGRARVPGDGQPADGGYDSPPPYQSGYADDPDGFDPFAPSAEYQPAEYQPASYAYPTPSNAPATGSASGRAGKRLGKRIRM